MQPPSNPTRVRRLAAPQLPASGTPPPTPRPVVFELHIRPLFRSLDREHMSFRLNLWKYLEAPPAQRVPFYQHILDRLQAPNPAVTMPPTNEGGPWPEEWIALFARWVQAGAPQLERALADPTSLTAVRDPASGTVDVTAAGQKPSAGHVVWLERAFDPDQLFNEYLPAQFVLYQEQRTTAPAAAVPFAVDDFFTVPAAAGSVTVVDSSGPHVVPIT